MNFLFLAWQKRQSVLYYGEVMIMTLEVLFQKLLNPQKLNCGMRSCNSEEFKQKPADPEIDSGSLWSFI